MIISIYGEETECSKVVKDADSIALFDATGEVFRLDTGISAFDGYVMIEGEWIEDEPQHSEDDVWAELDKAYQEGYKEGVNSI